MPVICVAVRGTVSAQVGDAGEKLQGRVTAVCCFVNCSSSLVLSHKVPVCSLIK